MKKLWNHLTNYIPALAMIYFAIPKLLAKPQSVAGFQTFENAIHINADFFRIFTGVSELALATLILIFAINKNRTIGRLAFAFLLITMVTALALEFFARPEPKTLLVVIALILASISIYKLRLLSKELSK